MIRHYLLVAALFVASAINTAAQHIDNVRAAEIAISEVFPNDGGGEVVLTQTVSDPEGGLPAFYVFNRASGGFALVAADERVPHVVLGYSDSGEFNYDGLPDAARHWMEGYIRQVREVRNGVNLKRTKTKGRRRAWGDEGLPNAVPTLMGHFYGERIAWGQWSPYNNYCPEKNGTICPTGCAATAMASVMFYHRHPAQGSGSNSYYWNGKELTANFEHSYYWDRMLREYRNGVEYPSEQKDAVATLMRDCGYSINMNYDETYGSGASEENVAKALVKYFDYDASVGHLIREYCGTEYWEHLVRSEIANGRPVLYGGGSDGGAHEFVCDGYDTDGKFYFRWGWTGGSDGYYASNDALGYSSSQTLVFNIKRNEGGSHTLLAGCDRDFFWDDATNRITCDIRFFTPVADAAVEVAVAVRNEADATIRYISSQSLTAVCTTNLPTTVNTFTINESFSDGEYALYPVYRRQGSNEWLDVLFGDFCQKEITMRVRNSNAVLTNEHLTENIDEGKVVIDEVCYMLNPSDHTATVTYKNSSYNSYRGEVTIPATVDYDGDTYSVTKIGEKALYQCADVTSVSIGRNVRQIEYGAMYSCGASTITFEEGSLLTTIDNYAFTNAKMTSLALPEGLRSIGSNAFQSCYELTELTLPASLTSMSPAAFGYCNYLTDVYVMAETPLTLSEGSNPFEGIGIFMAVMRLHVPSGSKALYQAAEVWKDFGYIIEMEGTGEPEPEPEPEPVLVNLTYRFIHEGVLWHTEQHTGVTAGTVYPAPLTQPYGVNYTMPSGSVPTSDSQIDITVTLSAEYPFTYSASTDNAVWYNLTMRGTKKVGYSSTSPNFPTAESQEQARFAFIGSPWQVKIFCKEAGGYLNNADPVAPVSEASAATYVFENNVVNGTNHYVFRLTDTTQQYLNSVSNSRWMGYWDHANASTDGGSSFTFAEVLPMVRYTIKNMNTNSYVNYSSAVVNSGNTIVTLGPSPQWLTFEGTFNGCKISCNEVTEQGSIVKHYIYAVNTENATYNIAYTTDVSQATTWKITDTYTSNDIHYYNIQHPDALSLSWNARGDAIVNGIRTLGLWNAGTSTGGNNGSLWQIEEMLVDIDQLQADVNALYNRCQTPKLGYPRQQTAQNLLGNYVGSNVREANAELAIAAYNSLMESTDINLPEDGKAYTFTSVHPDGKAYYVNYAESGLTLVARTEETELPASAVFVAHETSPGHYVFANNAGKYLAWKGSNAGTNGNKGYTDTWTELESDITVEKMVTGGTYNSGTAEQLFGCVDVLGHRGTSNVCFIIDNGGSFNQDGSKTLRYNASHSTAFRMEEATYPYNKPVLRQANGAYYSTIYLPFAMEVPENVKAYAVTEEYEANVDGTVTSFLRLAKAGESGTELHSGAYILFTDDLTEEDVEDNDNPASINRLVAPAAAAPEACDGNVLFGSTLATADVADLRNPYVLSGKRDSNGDMQMGFYPYVGSEYPLGKAIYSAGSNVSAFKFSFSNDEDIVEAIRTIENENLDAVVFDLQGRIHEKVGRGLNIRNAKKVLVK